MTAVCVIVPPLPTLRVVVGGVDGRGDVDGRTGLSGEAIAFFKQNGYLLLPGAVADELCDRAVDLLWSRLPTGSDMRRDDPATQVGPFSEHDFEEGRHNSRRGFRWNLREIASVPLLTDMAYSQRLCTVVEHLLGSGMLRRPIVDGKPVGGVGFDWGAGSPELSMDTTGVRGTYCTLPYGDKAPEPDGIHADAHPFHLGMVALLEDVEPEGGAFKVWPGSHRRLYPTFYRQYDTPRVLAYDHLPGDEGLLHSPEYHAEIERIRDDTPPVDCWGERGDVVLWHHRLAHATGANNRDRMRIALLADYIRTDLDVTRKDPPQPDMWRDWSEALQASEGSYSPQFASEQRLVG